MPSKINLSKSVIDNVKPPKAGRVFIYDAKVRRLCVQVTAAGAKSLYVSGKRHGKAMRVLICKWPDMTMEQIRKRAESINARWSDPDDSLSDRQQAREAETLGEAFAKYMAEHAKPFKRSWQTDEWQYKRFLLPWAGRRMASIKHGDVVALLTKTASEVGNVPANRLRSLLHTIFAKTFEGENPAAGIKKFDENKRSRYLNADELPRFLAALDNEPNQQFADFFRLALFTGARRGNLQSARWDEIDFQAGVWTIPASKSKSKKAIPVPLGAEAVAVLLLRLRDANGSPWVFPSHGASGHLAEPKAAWKRICKAAGIEGARIHDLRHTTASWMVAGGASLFQVSKTLGHSSVAMAERYSHMELTALRTAIGGATGAMMAAAKPKEGTNNG